MSETLDNTLTAYLGHEFQRNLMWQLLVEPEFANKIFPNLSVEYFDDFIMKRMFIIISEFYEEFGVVPNLQSKTIDMAINKYKKPNDIIDAESLAEGLKRVELWNTRVLNNTDLHHTGGVVRQATNEFIKQQKYRQIGELIITKVKNGKIKEKHTINEIEETFIKISEIGTEVDDSEEVFDNIDRALRKEFRETIPTGVEFIDIVTGGGLGKCEIGLILTPSGVGKTTLLTKIANTAYEIGKYVAQVIFEDTYDQIKRKHYTIWSGVAQSEIDNDLENIREFTHNKASELKGHGILKIKKFSQENTTIKDIRAWMESEEKKGGFKFELLVLDYLDCLEPHKRVPDRTEAELVIVKSFEALASEKNIPAWSAIQSNRSGFGADFLEAHQTGGSIKRIQKSHFFMSVAKGLDQKNSHFANVAIIKARFAKDGQRFENCIFNNDKIEIRVEDDRFKQMAINNGKKKHGSADIDKMHSKLSAINSENNSIDKANSDAVNEVVGDAVSDATKEAVFNDLRSQIKSIKPNNDFDKETKGIDAVEEINKIIKEEVGETMGIDSKEELKILVKANEQVEKKSIVDIENSLIDPDAPQIEYKTVHEMLTKSRENQDVIKK